MRAFGQGEQMKCREFPPFATGTPEGEINTPKMVGLVRFELTTSCTPCKRATRLRYSPMIHRSGQEAAPHGVMQALSSAFRPTEYCRGPGEDLSALALATAEAPCPAARQVLSLIRFSLDDSASRARRRVR